MKFPYPLFYSSFRFCRLMRATITLLYCATLNKGFFYIYLTHELTPQHLNSKMVPVLPSLNPSLIFIFPLLPSPLYPTGFSFYIFPGSLTIFILLSFNNIRSPKRQIVRGEKCPCFTTSTEISFWLISNWKEYDRIDSFPFDYEPNGFLLDL